MNTALAAEGCLSECRVAKINKGQHTSEGWETTDFHRSGFSAPIQRIDSGWFSAGFQTKNSPPKDLFSSEALAFHKIKTGTSSRRWRSVARGYW